MTVATALGEIAARVERELDAVVAAMDAAIVASVPAFGADATIRAEVSASCRANARRYLWVARRLPEPPSDVVPAEALDLARTVVRRGISSAVIYEGYRRGQQELWRAWMATAEEVVPPAELPAVLDRSLDLLITYADRVVARVIDEVERERSQVAAGALAQRAETIRLLLDDAPIDPREAARRLRYDLAREHTALVLWADAELAQGALERAAAAVARAAAATAPLTSPAGVSTLWAWLPGPAGDLERAGREAPLEPGIRVAAGSTRRGPAGFRRSHEEALAVQRLVRRRPAGPPLARFDELEITALAGHDEERALEFVERTLGGLAAPTARAARLRETLRVYLEEADHAPRAAARLHTHRNTVLQRVARATELLGHRPGERRLAVALALELDRRLRVGS